MIRKKQTAIVVLDGIKVLTESTGIAPLCKAIQEVVNPEDEIIILTLLSVKNASDLTSSNLNTTVNGDVHQYSQSCETYHYIKFLHKEISQRKEDYLRIFRPFYYNCKNNGVKFQVKVAIGFRPKDIIIEEANNVKATSIVMDYCFSRYLTFQLRGINCNVSLVSNDEEAMVKNCIPSNDTRESSSTKDTMGNPQSQKRRKGSLLSSEVVYFPSSLQPDNSQCLPSSSSVPAILRKENEQQILLPHTCQNDKSYKGTISSETSIVKQKKHDSSSIKVNNLFGQPLQLTWEVIMEITQDFKSRICNGQNRNYMSYYGYFEDHQSFVLVKRYAGDSGSILEAETKAALFLHHNNIRNMIGYYKSEEDTILVFPFDIEGTLDKHLCDFSRKQWELTFQDKLKIAIGIAQGIRYLHEECPRAPIAHGKLQLNNIFLTSHLQPMIAGFEQATWLQVKQKLPAFTSRYKLEDCLGHGSMVLLKSDIYAFGVLLLRLFCKRSMSQDDKILIDWARPLLLDRAFHLLLDENSDDFDMHEIFKVMCAARMCTISKPISRPSITEVISVLRGEDFCIIQSSPSDNSA